MDKRTDSVIKQYITSVASEIPGFVAAYLFGSYANNTQREESDIDIAIFITNITDRFEMQIKLMLLASSIDSRIEPHPFSSEELTSDQPFIQEIKRTGVEINTVKV